MMMPATALFYLSLLSPLVPVAGTVEEMTPEAEEKSGLRKGQRVMALVGGGGYAGEEIIIY